MVSVTSVSSVKESKSPHPTYPGDPPPPTQPDTAEEPSLTTLQENFQDLRKHVDLKLAHNLHYREPRTRSCSVIAWKRAGNVLSPTPLSHANYQTIFCLNLGLVSE